MPEPTPRLIASTVDASLERLIQRLDERATLLEARGEARWADWARRDLARIRDHDAHGLEHFLSANRGFLDVIGGGDDDAPLRAAYDDAYALASDLWRDYQRESHDG